MCQNDCPFDLFIVIVKAETMESWWCLVWKEGSFTWFQVNL